MMITVQKINRENWVILEESWYILLKLNQCTWERLWYIEDAVKILRTMTVKQYRTKNIAKDKIIKMEHLQIFV